MCKVMHVVHEHRRDGRHGLRKRPRQSEAVAEIEPFNQAQKGGNDAVNPYLFYNGNCEAAFKFYEKVLGGKIELMMTQEGRRNHADAAG